MKALSFRVLLIAGIALLFAGVANAQNIGIGTTNPQAKLQIVPDSAAALSISPYGVNAGQTGQFRLFELTANGNNYVAVKAPDAIGSNVIFVLPNTAGTNGQQLTTDGNGNLSWGAAGGGGGGGGGNSYCYTCDGF